MHLVFFFLSQSISTRCLFIVWTVRAWKSNPIMWFLFFCIYLIECAWIVWGWLTHPDNNEHGASLLHPPAHVSSSYNISLFLSVHCSCTRRHHILIMMIHKFCHFHIHPDMTSYSGKVDSCSVLFPLPTQHLQLHFPLRILFPKSFSFFTPSHSRTSISVLIEVLFPLLPEALECKEHSLQLSSWCVDDECRYTYNAK